jgi:hypothetical protein
MALGPGRYDDACTAARILTGGQVILIVADGRRGDGFSCQCTEEMLRKLPDMLESVAAQIREDTR